jgi:hypothetical protein
VLALHRGENKDSALPLGHHLGGEGANGVRRAVQIVVDHIAPVRVFHLEERLPALDRRIGDDDVDLSELLLRLIGDPPERHDISDIGANGFGASPQRADHLGGLFQFLRRRGNCIGRGRNGSGDVDRNNVGPVRSELDRDRATDPTRRARNDCDFA